MLYIAAVNVISNLQPDSLAGSDKDWIDYFMIVVLGFSWVRFFFYFLVVGGIAELILTLIAMLIDAISFMILVICLILVFASVFTTLYQD